MLQDAMYVKLCHLQAFLPTAYAVPGIKGKKREEGKEMSSSSPHSLSEAEWQQPSADQHPWYKSMSEMFPPWTQGLVADKWWP